MNGIWGTVCDYGWDRNDALVVCNQLGFYTNRKAVVAVKNARYGEGSGPVWIGNVRCNGSELRIEDCAFDSHPAGPNCGHNHDAGVECQSGYLTSSPDSTGVRLFNHGKNNTIGGRVEIQIGGRWGTICDRGWDLEDANIVCKQLRSPGAVAVVKNAAFGVPTEPSIRLHRTDVDCGVDKTTLQDCFYDQRNLYKCTGMQQYAGVICYNSKNSAVSIDVSLEQPQVKGPSHIVSISIEGVSGRVCANNWNFSEADVVCRQVNEKGLGAVAAVRVIEPKSRYPIWFDGLTCSGTESRLEHCFPKEWKTQLGVNRCLHDEFAGVLCSQ
jgi:hypothetical protein